MRITCPHCGERSHAEFTYLGDAAPRRPEAARAPAPEAWFSSPVAEAFVDYVYFRTNPPGVLAEWWQHTGGCRAWIRVERNVTTHAVGTVTAAPGTRGATGLAEESAR